jgi:hypothetical protein
MMIQVRLREVARYCLFGMEVVSLAELKKEEHPAADITGTKLESIHQSDWSSVDARVCDEL